MECQNPEIKTVYLSEAIKRVLSARYLTMFSDSEGILRKEYNHFLNRALIEYKNLVGISIKQKSKFVLLIKIPGLYRVYRILTDRTMIDWERKQKKR